MKKKIIVLLILLAVVCFGGYHYFFNIEEHTDAKLTSYGNVEIREVNLGFRVSGRVSDVLKDEGNAVDAGTLLATVDAEPLQYQLDSLVAQRQAVEAAYNLLVNGYRKEDIDQVRADLAYSRSVYNESKTELERQVKLDKAKAGRQQDLDQATSNLEQAKAQLDAAEAKYSEYCSGYREEDIEKAKAQVTQLKAEIASVQLQLRDTQLKSPSKGIILTRAIEVGSMVSVGQAAFTVSLQDQVWVRSYISQTRLGNIHPGMKVSIYTDSLPGQPYEGHIGFISSQAEFTPKYVQTEDLRSDLVYRFRIIVDGDVQGLRQGMPVTVKLHTGE